jgi:hypothetical protein
MKVFDVLRGADNDLLFENGDLKVGESTYQHIGLIVNTQKGAWRFAPRLGAAIDDTIMDDGSSQLEKQGNIQEALELDGVRIISLIPVDTGKFYVEGKYGF